MSKKSMFMVAAFVMVALGAPISGARAQTSPDIPGTKTGGGGGHLVPVTDGPVSGGRGTFVSFTRFETVTTPWVARLVAGRSWVNPYSISYRRRVVR